MRKFAIFGVILVAAVIATCSFLGNTIWLRIINEKGDPISDAQLRFSWRSGEPWGPSTHSGTQHFIVKFSNYDGLASAHISEDHYVCVEVAAKGYEPIVADIVDDSLRKHTKAKDAFTLILKKVPASR